MHPDVEQYLAAIVRAARDVLGDDLLGAYAAGSVGLDAFEPGTSDVDVALVCEDVLDGERKAALVSRLRHEALPCPARGLELVVYRNEVAGNGSPEPGFELELNTGPRMAFRVTRDPRERPVEDGRFWYGLDRSILHQSGRTLFGPPAPRVFADLSPAPLHRLLLEALTWWVARPTPAGDEPAPGADDAVLGACRALVKHRHGTWLSKVDAGHRLVDSGFEVPLVERSLAARRGLCPAPSGPQARAFQHRVIDEVSRRPPGGLE